MTKDEMIERIAEIIEALSVLDRCKHIYVNALLGSKNGMECYGNINVHAAMLRTALLVEKEYLEAELKEVL